MPRPEGVGEKRSSTRGTSQSGGRPAGVGSGRPIAKKDDDGKSVGGFLGNLVSGAKNAVVGLGPGIYKVGSSIAEDYADAAQKGDFDFDRTKGVASGIKDQYVDTYGPAFKGDFGKTWDKVYDDPFGPVTDVITILAGGATGATKLGLKAPAAGGKITVASRSGKTAEKIAARSEIRATGQKAANAALTKLPGALDKTGATTVARGADRLNEWRIGRIQSADLKHAAKTLEQSNIPYLRVLGKVKDADERVATWAIANMPLRKDFDAYVAHLKTLDTHQARATVAILERPKVQKAFDAPNQKMLDTLEKARRLGEEQVRALGIDPKTALERQYMHTQLARGGRFITEKDAKAYQAIQDRMPDNPQVAATFTGSGRLPTESGVFGAPKVDDLRAEIVAAGRPEPVYLPDMSQVRETGADAFLGRGGGKGQPTKTGAQRQNQGILFMSGQLIMDPAVLNASWLKAVKFRHYNDVHDTLVENADRFAKSETLPKGWEYVRAKRSDKISAKAQQAGDFEDWAKAHLNDDAEFLMKDNPFTTRHVGDDIATDGDFYLAVPTAYSRALRGEFTRASTFVRFMNAKPLRVWRAMVLGLRPAWLVNNIVGNTLMYIMGSNDLRAITSLMDSMKRLAPKHQWDDFDRILQKKFTVSESGTFIGTQFPHLRAKVLPARIAQGIVSFLPKIDKVWDQSLRRAMIRTELKKNPQIIARAKAMKLENRDFWKAAIDELDANPDLVKQIEGKVHDVLGNFENLSQFERTTVRSVIPFWAWYRAITAVTLKLPFDSPVRVNLLGRLGEIGVESYIEQYGINPDEVPDALRGFIAFGMDPDGRIRGLNSAGANPYATTIDIGQMVAALSFGESGSAAKTLVALNPYYEGLIERIQGRDIQTGRPIESNVPGGVVGGTIVGVGESFPQWRVIQALRGQLYSSGDTYNDRDVVDESLRFGGVPYARVSPSRAREIGPG